MRAERQVGHGALGHAAQIEEIDQGLGAFTRLGLDARRARQPQGIAQKARVVLAVAAHQRVLAHGHAAKQRQVLESAAYANARHAVARHARQRVAVEADAAAIAFVEARQTVEQSALARAVGAYQSANLAALHIEGHAVQRHDAAEAYRNTGDVQQGLVCAIVVMGHAAISYLDAMGLQSATAALSLPDRWRGPGNKPQGRLTAAR
ncbi:hypothetical protein D3C80_1443220 [compost metagenome]